MILLVHMLFGVAVASLTKNPYLAILVAFLSHYFLDIFPHIEYPIDNLKNIKKLLLKSSARGILLIKILPEFLYLVFDVFIGILLIFIFTDKNLLYFICALFAIVPDSLTVLSAIMPNKPFGVTHGKILKIHDKFHREIIHFLRDKKISNFIRMSTQILAVIIAILILKK
jgi:hypothetical protein